MVNIVYTLAAMLLTLMLIDYIVSKISKFILNRKITKRINYLSEKIIEEIERIEKEEEENEE